MQVYLHMYVYFLFVAEISLLVQAIPKSQKIKSINKYFSVYF